MGSIATADSEPHLNCCRAPDISTGEVLLLERKKSESASTKYDANITPPRNANISANAVSITPE
jgi:hypothetical protein